MAQKIKSSGRARKSVPSNEEFVYYDSVVRATINRPPGMVNVRVPYGTWARQTVTVHLEDIPDYMMGDYSDAAGRITPEEFETYEKNKDYKNVKKYFIAIKDNDVLKESTAENINEQLRIIHNELTDEDLAREKEENEILATTNTT